jgi:hypothetical protein
VLQVSKRREYSKEILERMENGKYDTLSCVCWAEYARLGLITAQLCDYLEEYHSFFTKGRDKLTELMPVIAKYRNKVKEFFDEKSRVESDHESIEEDDAVDLNDFLKVRQPV